MKRNSEINKITNILFLCVFFILLWTPLCCMKFVNPYNPEELYPYWVPLSSSPQNFNHYFGKNFEDWFKFRFVFRKQMINTYCTLPLKMFGKNERGAYNKSSGDLYNVWEFIPYGEYIINEKFKALISFNEFCEKNGINLYVFVTPQKPRIYPTDLGIYNQYDMHEEFINFVDNIKDLKVVYPYKDLIKDTKTQRLFFKPDHHWTDDGAYIGYKSLTSKIKQDFPQVKILQPNDFDYFYNKKIRFDFSRKFEDGRTGYILGFFPKDIQRFHSYDYRYYRHKDFDNLKIKTIRTDYRRSKDSYYQKAPDLKVLVFGSSMTENLIEFLPYTFRTFRYIRLNPGASEGEEDYKILKKYKNEILEYKPDIIIFSASYNNIYNFDKVMETD